MSHWAFSSDSVLYRARSQSRKRRWQCSQKQTSSRLWREVRKACSDPGGEQPAGLAALRPFFRPAREVGDDGRVAQAVGAHAAGCILFAAERTGWIADVAGTRQPVLRHRVKARAELGVQAKLPGPGGELGKHHRMGHARRPDGRGEILGGTARARFGNEHVGPRAVLRGRRRRAAASRDGERTTAADRQLTPRPSRPTPGGTTRYGRRHAPEGIDQPGFDAHLDRPRCERLSVSFASEPAV